MFDGKVGRIDNIRYVVLFTRGHAKKGVDFAIVNVLMIDVGFDRVVLFVADVGEGIGADLFDGGWGGDVGSDADGKRGAGLFFVNVAFRAEGCFDLADDTMNVVAGGTDEHGDGPGDADVDLIEMDASGGDVALSADDGGVDAGGDVEDVGVDFERVDAVGAFEDVGGNATAFGADVDEPAAGFCVDVGKGGAGVF